MISNYIHFVYGLDKNFSNKPFCFFHYLAVASAKKCNNCEIMLHIKYEPANNEWWNKTKSLVSLKEICLVPSEICGKQILHIENACDLLRLQILNEYGGIYLDIDTLSIKSFNPLLNYSFVMGKEEFKGHLNGLCNAVILAESKSKFGQLWLDSFSDFKPEVWNYMAVQKPFQLSNENPELIHIEPVTSFFKYDWHTIIDLFNGDSNDLDGVYVIHLWESKLYHSILKHISVDDIRTRRCCYNNIIRDMDLI